MRTIRRVICLLVGHRYHRSVAYAPKFYTCLRCGGPGFDAPRRES